MFQRDAGVLIVEDDVLVGLLLASMVEELGYEVVGPCRTLRDGLAHARADVLGFALLDFDLGRGTNAVPIAEVLAGREIPFAFASGTPPAEIRCYVPDAVVLSKPLTESELAGLLS
jgi:DNA-binding response OmpR family regulator